MSGEDMEIMTDLGQPGFSEDIDIDIDFGTEQPDEDLELTDFDQAQDATVFNMDPKDEMMDDGDDVGGDNESYSMIDADDEGHHETAASAINDIEIDIGGLDEESMWPGEDPVQPKQDSGGLQNASETITTTERIDPGNAQESADQISAAPVSADAVTLAETDVKDYGAQEPEARASITSDQVTDPLVSKTELSAAESEGNTMKPDLDSTPQDHSVSQAAPGEVQVETPVDDQQAADSVDADTNDDIDWNAGAEGDQPTQVVDEEPTEDDQESGSTHNNAETAPQQALAESTSFHGTEAQGAPIPSEVLAEETIIENTDENDNDNEPELGAEVEHPPETGDQDNGPRDAAGEAFDEADTPGQDVDDDWNDEASRPEEETTLDTVSDWATFIAGRYQLLISYGETDYRLFAKSEDDDPNQYFLSDLTALDLPLSGFLSSLREVISEEVSPLDELVMHVDGLGLEFAESSTPKLLDQYTFGHLVRLYDGLAKNDGTDSSTDMFTYLMVRPSCQQRLAALFDSAKAGRGLSEIAVYRESTPPFETIGLPSRSNSSSPAPDAEDAADDAYAHPEPGFNPDDAETGETHDLNDQEEHEEYHQDGGEAEYEYHENEHHAEGIEAHASGEADGGQERAVADSEAAEDYKNPGGAALETAVDAVNDQADDDLFDLSDPDADANASASTKDQPIADNPSQPDQLAKPTQEHQDQSAEDSLQLPADQQAFDAPGSVHSSATATLNGDSNDIIDYSEDEEEATEANTNGKTENGSTLQVPVDDEITWESENEDPSETPAAQKPAQVSPAHGKRSRSDIEDNEDQGGEIDVKRHRS